MDVTNQILCPRCGADALYKYGKTKEGVQRYLCIVCKKQFTMKTREITKKNPVCPSCGSLTYVYMKDQGRGIVRYRCSKYPNCKTYLVRRLS